jgi:hypothetical protein
LISPDVALQIPLLKPDLPGSTIKKIRGTIPLDISARRDDPLIVPLDRAATKTFSNPDVQITVHDVRTRSETRQTLLEISISASDGSIPEQLPDLFLTTDSQLQSGPHPYQLEIIDERNQIVPWLSGFDAESSHIILTLTQLPQAPRLKELRYFSLTRGVVQLPFEFSEIPMP